MAFWIFKCNPSRYRLQDRLADANPTLTWTVSRFSDEILPADIVFLWETGANRGIKAMMRVDQAPRMMAELETEQAYWRERDTTEQLRVVGTLVHRDLCLAHITLREIDGLDDLSVFQGF